MSNEASQDPAKTIEENRRQMILEQLQRSDDFGFELKTKGTFEAVGARVTHGWTYIDPIEEKPRQFDLRAQFLNYGTERHHLWMAAECKNLDPAAPLVISGTRRTRDESFYDFVRADGTVGLRQHVMRAQADCYLYQRDEFVGKSMLRLKPDEKAKGSKLVPASDKESDVYGRWSQALASAGDLCKEAAFVGGNTGKVHESIVLPAVIVPDGSLWTVEYNKDGTIFEGPKAAKSATFFVDHEITIVPKNLWTNLSHVHFFTLTGLREFLAPLNRFPSTDWFPTSAERHQPPVH